jgi:hypothetical protein
VSRKGEAIATTVTIKVGQWWYNFMGHPATPAVADKKGFDPA